MQAIEYIAIILVGFCIFYIGYRTDFFNFFKRIYMRNFEKDVINVATAYLWIESDSEVIWSNRVYEKNLEWFGRKLLFRDFTTDGPHKPESAWQRATLLRPYDGKTLHFFVRSLKFKDYVIYAATSADSVLKVEREKERIVQTLSSAFSDLPIGIAIFDESKELTLFNPALSELLNISPEWLAKRPTLNSVLDHLRDNGKLPEPKDFKAWRASILSLQDSASKEGYKDDWYMPNGRVLRVKGQAQERGTIAFNFENISRANTIEREYRLEIERLYSVLDLMDPALVLFDASGSAIHFNPAFDEMWQTKYTDCLSPPTISGLCEHWLKNSAPNPIWSEILDFTSNMVERAAWSANAHLIDGPHVTIYVNPMADGYTLIEFSISNTKVSSKPSQKKKLKQRV